MDLINQIVETMTKQEVRHFKLFTSRLEYSYERKDLELFNYIAHYGLQRQRTGAGHEPFGEGHSWNSSNALANALIFNMGRHSWHHARPAASYESLKCVAAAPELPAGYAGSILMALIPPLWRRIMDPAVQKFHTAASNASV